MAQGVCRCVDAAIGVDPGEYRLAFYDPGAAYGFEWHDDLGTSGMASSTVVTATAGTPLVTGMNPPPSSNRLVERSRR